jgi:hypothetical protein
VVGLRLGRASNELAHLKSSIQEHPEPMRHLSRSLAIGLVAVILAGCLGQSPSASPSASVAPASVPPSEAAASQPPPASETPAPEPSEDATGPFTCDLPVHVNATVPLANITDVRVGTHDGYDRVVFEFSDGIPEAFLERATPPFTHDASGAPITVDGTSFLRLILRGGTKQTEDGTSSYTGSTDFDAGLPALVHLIEGGDFEAQSTWYLGLSAEACVRVMALVGEGGSPRLVIDIEH